MPGAMSKKLDARRQFPCTWNWGARGVVRRVAIAADRDGVDRGRRHARDRFARREAGISRQAGSGGGGVGGWGGGGGGWGHPHHPLPMHKARHDRGTSDIRRCCSINAVYSLPVGLQVAQEGDDRFEIARAHLGSRRP